jgi:hypothetical protein
VFLTFAQHLGETAKCAARHKNLAIILGFQVSFFSICVEEEWIQKVYILPPHHTDITTTFASIIFITICIISASSLLPSTLSPWQ